MTLFLPRIPAPAYFLQSHHELLWDCPDSERSNFSSFCFLSLSFGCWPELMHAFMDTFGFLSLFIKTISLPCNCQWPYDWPQSQLKSKGMGFCFPFFLWLHQTAAKIKSFSVLSPFLLNSNKVALSFLLGPFLNSFINETKNTRVFPWRLHAIYLIPEFHFPLPPKG